MSERIGAYLWADEFAQAKSAYLADWRADHHFNTFAAWVQDAVRVHVERSPRERQLVADNRPEQSSRRGIRSFTMDDGTREAITAARRADEHQDRFVPEHGWTAEAIIAATQAAITRHDTLPPAPARLPNRLS